MITFQNPQKLREIYGVELAHELKPGQQDHIDRMMKIMNSYDVAIDTSDPGMGKTYTTCAIARMTKCSLLVVGPKTLSSKWEMVAAQHDVPILYRSHGQIRSTNSELVRKIEKSSALITSNIPIDEGVKYVSDKIPIPSDNIKYRLISKRFMNSSSISSSTPSTTPSIPARKPCSTSSLPKPQPSEITFTARDEFIDLIKSTRVLVVYDECHHLKNDSQQSAACIAITQGTKHPSIEIINRPKILLLSGTLNDKKDRILQILALAGIVTVAAPYRFDRSRKKCIVSQDGLDFGLKQLYNYCVKIDHTTPKRFNPDITQLNSHLASKISYNLYNNILKPRLTSGIVIPIKFPYMAYNYYARLSDDDLKTHLLGCSILSQSIPKKVYMNSRSKDPPSKGGSLKDVNKPVSMSSFLSPSVSLALSSSLSPSSISPSSPSSSLSPSSLSSSLSPSSISPSSPSSSSSDSDETKLGGLNTGLSLLCRSKINAAVKLVNLYLEKYPKCKAIIAVKFIDIIFQLKNRLIEWNPLVYYGKLNVAERDECRNSFQDDSSRRLLLINPQVGAEGIDLHDTSGDQPRVLIQFPDYDLIMQYQMSNRISRPQISRSYSIVLFLWGISQYNLAQDQYAGARSKILKFNTDIDIEKKDSDEIVLSDTIKTEYHIIERANLLDHPSTGKILRPIYQDIIPSFSPMSYPTKDILTQEDDTITIRSTDSRSISNLVRHRLGANFYETRILGSITKKTSVLLNMRSFEQRHLPIKFPGEYDNWVEPSIIRN